MRGRARARTGGNEIQSQVAIRKPDEQSHITTEIVHSFDVSITCEVDEERRAGSLEQVEDLCRRSLALPDMTVQCANLSSFHGTSCRVRGALTCTQEGRAREDPSSTAHKRRSIPHGSPRGSARLSGTRAEATTFVRVEVSRWR